MGAKRFRENTCTPQTTQQGQHRAHATKKPQWTYAIIGLSWWASTVWERRRQLRPIRRPWDKSTLLVEISLSFTGIISELIGVRAVFRRIYDIHIRREMVAASIPEPQAHPVRPVRRWGFLDRRLRRREARSLHRGRWEWILASVGGGRGVWRGTQVALLWRRVVWRARRGSVGMQRPTRVIMARRRVAPTRVCR